MNYQNELEKIPFYKLHPSYIPFVGRNYDEYKILQISESHYCEAITDREKYGIRYFENWFSTKCAEVENNLIGENFTRNVCNGVLKNENTFRNFDNPLRSFCNIVLKYDNIRLSKYNDNRKKYSYFAFMNFYQIPAFKDKACFKDAFYKEAKSENIPKDEQYKIIEKWRNESTSLIDEVIDILNPRAVVFTSIDAWESYDNNNGKYKNDNRIIRSAHPNWPWNKFQRKLDKTGKQAFEDGLKRIYLCE